MTDMQTPNQGMGKMQKGGARDDADISSLGMMMQRSPNISEADRTEMKEFRKQVMESSRSGEFDAAALAEQAPSELKSYADEMGIDLTDMFTQLNEKKNQFQGMQQKGMGGMQGDGMSYGMNGSKQEDPLVSLMDTLFGKDDSES